jgi:hypothetical protein
MADSCSVSVFPPGTTDLGALGTQFPLFFSLSIISKSQHNPIDLSQFQVYKLQSSGELVDILSSSLNQEFYLQAIPSSQSNNDIDNNKLIVHNGTLKLWLNESTYITVPNVSKFATVKKLTHKKVGHGSKNLVNYSYSISLPFTALPPELVYILNSKFTTCEIITTFKIDPATLKSTAACQSLQQDINLSPLMISPKEIYQNPLEFYEYLSLLNLNSLQLSLKLNIDDFLSIYQPPQSLSQYNECLFQHTLTDVSFCVQQILLQEDWVCINGHSTKGNIVIFKSPNDNSIVVWQVNYN